MERAAFHSELNVLADVARIGPTWSRRSPLFDRCMDSVAKASLETPSKCTGRAAAMVPAPCHSERGLPRI